MNHADDNVLELVYKMVKMYEGDDDSSLMDNFQKDDIENRSTLVQAGKLKTCLWKDVKNKSKLN